jgi:adenine-specific DNA-methyltransferase
MGTKRALAPVVSDVIRSAQRGVMLDAFSGMCAVGEVVGNARNVWNNDVQVFAAEVARALFMSKAEPPSPLTVGDVHFDCYRVQRERLSTYFLRSLALEDAATATAEFSDFKRVTTRLRIALNKDIAACRLRSPHLFSTTYSGTFFGIRQAIDCDAIVAALQSAKLKGRVSEDDYRWGIIALGRSLLKIAHSTGHFAQYLIPKPNNYRRYIALRKRSLWEEWLSSFVAFAPVSTAAWRSGNRVFNEDSLLLLPQLVRSKVELGVIYADPPYTDDQYSRFYHVLETLYKAPSSASS